MFRVVGDPGPLFRFRSAQLGVHRDRPPVPPATPPPGKPHSESAPWDFLDQDFCHV
jgi:hypothetical protein